VEIFISIFISFPSSIVNCFFPRERERRQQASWQQRCSFAIYLGITYTQLLLLAGLPFIGPFVCVNIKSSKEKLSKEKGSAK